MKRAALAAVLLLLASTLGGFLYYLSIFSDREPLKIRGVVYDVGPKADAELVHRELEIIKNDLHANAVRLTGSDTDPLIVAAEDALKQGLEVWLTPMFPGKDEQETTALLLEVARRAEQLRERYSNVVLIVGLEMTLTLEGILEYEGDLFDYIQTPAFEEAITSGETNTRLNAALANLTEAVRPVFKGKLTYASILFEQVDWSMFDIVSADLYRDASTKLMFPFMVKNYLSHDKPFVVTEFGSTTYKDADTISFEDAVDDLEHPTRVVGNLVRDEAAQAREVTNVLNLFDRMGADGAFAFTFKEAGMPHDEANPERDLDMASFSLVKTYTNRRGTTYPDMPWEPKKAFWAIAEAYKNSSEQNP